MRTLGFILMLSFSLNAAGAVKTALKIPTTWRYQTDDDVYLNPAEIRRALRDHGKAVPEFPDYYIATLGDGWKPAAQFEEELEAKLTEAFKGIPFMQDGDVWNSYYPTSVDTPAFPTCYLGNPMKLWDIFSDIVGTFNTEQAVALGWRYKDKKFVYGDDGTFEEQINEQSSQWAGWTGQGTDILFLFSTTDDGDDVNPALISKCR